MQLKTTPMALGPFISVILHPTYIPGVTRRSKFDSMTARSAPTYSTSASEYACSCLLQLTDLSLFRSSILFDSNKTLHAKLTHSPVTSTSTSSPSREQDRVTSSPGTTYSPVSPNSPYAARPANSYPPWSAPSSANPQLSAGSPPQTGRKKKKRPRNEVHVTLRRGGR
jgi:hypothetical protein